MIKILLLIVLFAGVILITVAITKEKYNNVENNDKTIEYRYIPRTFDEENNSPVYPSEIFKTMFSQQSPWIFSINSFDRKKQEGINKFFINQY